MEAVAQTFPRHPPSSSSDVSDVKPSDHQVEDLARDCTNMKGTNTTKVENFDKWILKIHGDVGLEKVIVSYGDLEDIPISPSIFAVSEHC